MSSSSSTTATTTIRKAPVSPTKRDQINHDDFNLKEWGLKSRLVSRDNTGSRRFSASYIRTIREVDAARSFRSNLTVSSTTASSPAYNYLTEEINPSTYSFTTALRALQARSSNCWELQSPELGLTLNSKWNEAEKYISNPFSGEVPMECLSAKTLGNASFRQLTGRITMSAPLVYSKQAYHYPNNKPKDELLLFPVQEKTSTIELGTKNVGTQSAEPHLNYSSCNSSPPPASTPSIKDVRPVKHQVEESPVSSITSITRSISEEKLEVKETRENNNHDNRSRENDEKKQKKKMGKQKVGECFSLRGCSLWTMITKHHHHHHNHKGETDQTRPTRKNNASVHHHFHNRSSSC